MPEHLDRDHVIDTIRAELRRRSGKPWSVTGGKGTGWGWITITAPPRRRDAHGGMTAEDVAELANLLNMPGRVHPQGVNVADSDAYYREYVARAKGETPTILGTPYWD